MQNDKGMILIISIDYICWEMQNDKGMILIIYFGQLYYFLVSYWLLLSPDNREKLEKGLKWYGPSVTPEWKGDLVVLWSVKICC